MKRLNASLGRRRYTIPQSERLESRRIWRTVDRSASELDLDRESTRALCHLWVAVTMTQRSEGLGKALRGRAAFAKALQMREAFNAPDIADPWRLALEHAGATNLIVHSIVEGYALEWHDLWLQDYPLQAAKRLGSGRPSRDAFQWLSAILGEDFEGWLQAKLKNPANAMPILRKQLAEHGFP